MEENASQKMSGVVLGAQVGMELPRSITPSRSRTRWLRMGISIGGRLPSARARSSREVSLSFDFPSARTYAIQRLSGE